MDAINLKKFRSFIHYFCNFSLYSATIELVQVDSSGEPLSIGQTLDNLMAITEQLEKSDILLGIEVESVSAINPSEYMYSCLYPKKTRNRYMYQLYYVWNALILFSSPLYTFHIVTCTSECVNGECTDRDTCTCDKGWTGATCDKKRQGKLSMSH